jgi:hypothetical protein
MDEDTPHTSGKQFAEEIIAALTGSGIDLADSQSFSFHLRVGNESDAQQCAAEVDLIGLETEVKQSAEEEDNGCWLCVASMAMTPNRERLVEIGDKFIELADKYKGEFAGWEVNTDDLSDVVEGMFGSFFEQLGGLLDGDDQDDGEDDDVIDVGGPNFDKPLSPEADHFLKQASDEFNVKQAHLRDEWRFDECDQWAFDQETGVFKLEFEDGSMFEAQGQILGSHDPDEGSWEWAWNNPNVEKAVASDSLIVRALGEKLEIDYLCEGKAPLPEESFVSHLCGIGIKATDSFGVYNGSAGEIMVMILLKNPRWASPDQS